MSKILLYFTTAIVDIEIKKIRHLFVVEFEYWQGLKKTAHFGTDKLLLLQKLKQMGFAKIIT